MRKALIVLLLLVPALCPGCQCLNYWLFVFAPAAPPKAVDAEYDGLQDSTVAVVIYADERVLYEYPMVRLDLGMMVGGYLQQNVKKCTVVDPQRVASYQQRNIYWDREGRTELGKKLGADYVLFISLIEYTTHVKGSLNLYRGELIADVALHKVDLPERGSRVWGPDRFHVSFPENAPGGRPAEDDRLVAVETRRRFADRLTKKFYDHKVQPAEDGEEEEQ